MAEGDSIQISVEETKKLKKQAEEEIRKILSAFFERTGLGVTGIGVESEPGIRDRVFLRCEI